MPAAPDHHDLSDLRAMRLALHLARRGIGRTSPNPPVGAVVVKDGRILGEGSHVRAGEAHAEVLALDQAGTAARDATLYVSLEPCCHYGRTPPCTDRIIASGVRRVAYAAADPNPLVAGRGGRALVEAGLTVEEGLLREEGRRLIVPFTKFILTGIPFVVLKLAISLDGKIAAADGTSRWITGAIAREHAHKLRDRADAVLVGIETILADNSSLTTRLRGKVETHDPVRVVLDSHLRIPPDAQVLTVPSPSPAIVACTHEAPADREKVLVDRGVQVIRTSDRAGRVDLMELMRELGQRGIVELLVEGGQQVATGFLRTGLVDRLVLMVAPILLGGPLATGFTADLGISSLEGALRLRNLRTLKAGDDVILEADLRELAGT